MPGGKPAINQSHALQQLRRAPGRLARAGAPAAAGVDAPGPDGRGQATAAATPQPRNSPTTHRWRWRRWPPSLPRGRRSCMGRRRAGQQGEAGQGGQRVSEDRGDIGGQEQRCAVPCCTLRGQAAVQATPGGRRRRAGEQVGAPGGGEDPGEVLQPAKEERGPKCKGRRARDAAERWGTTTRRSGRS